MLFNFSSLIFMDFRSCCGSSSSTRQPLMKFCLAPTFSFLLYIAIFFPLAIADLESDKQALLDFIAGVPHGRKLNFTSTNPVCTSWVGVTCTQDGSRVLALRLPGIGLIACGSLGLQISSPTRTLSLGCMSMPAASGAWNFWHLSGISGRLAT